MDQQEPIQEPRQERLTLWMRKLRDGDRSAAQRLWEAYYDKLVLLARTRLRGRTRLVSDEEDVALSAFKSFCRGLEGGCYPRLADCDELWRLLVTITMHKSIKLVRDETRRKRGGDWNRLESSSDDAEILAELAGSEPSPQMAIQVADEFERLLSQLGSLELVELAMLKMEGYTNAEIAKKWNRAERTVERKLGLIRQLWEQELVRDND